jgi:hypothetical protein
VNLLVTFLFETSICPWHTFSLVPFATGRLHWKAWATIYLANIYFGLLNLRSPIPHASWFTKNTPFC